MVPQVHTAFFQEIRNNCSSSKQLELLNFYSLTLQSQSEEDCCCHKSINSDGTWRLLTTCYFWQFQWWQEQSSSCHIYFPKHSIVAAQSSKQGNSFSVLFPLLCRKLAYLIEQHYCLNLWIISQFHLSFSILLSNYTSQQLSQQVLYTIYLCGK